MAGKNQLKKTFLEAHVGILYCKQFLFFLKILGKKFLQETLGLVVKNKNGMDQENFHLQNPLWRKNVWNPSFI